MPVPIILTSLFRVKLYRAVYPVYVLDYRRIDEADDNLPQDADGSLDGRLELTDLGHTRLQYTCLDLIY